MDKRYCLCILLLLTSLRLTAQLHLKAYNNLQGILSFSNQNFNNLDAEGTIELKNVKVSQTTRFNGPVFATGLFTKNLQINGPTEVTHLTVLHKTNIYGPVQLHQAQIWGQAKLKGSLTAKASTFKQLMLTSNEAHFYNCNIDELVIHGDNKMPKQPQFVHLYGDNNIKKIHFELNQGIVFLHDLKASAPSKVTGGQVITYN